MILKLQCIFCRQCFESDVFYALCLTDETNPENRKRRIEELERKKDMTTYKVTPYKEDFAEGWGSNIEADSPESAVEKYMKTGKGTCYDGDKSNVFVLYPDGVVKRFSATCSMEISFAVEEAEDE